jgi:hypothetical protein
MKKNIVLYDKGYFERMYRNPNEACFEVCWIGDFGFLFSVYNFVSFGIVPLDE